MKGVFGGLIALVLLGLYVYAVLVGVGDVLACAATQGCSMVPVGKFTDGMALTMASVGGIVSALVIAELAITTPGQQPIGRSFTDNPTGLSSKITKIITGVYLLTWVAIGLLAFVVGVMQHPKMLEALTNLGQAWLGLAVSAVYAYLGIKPLPPNS